MIPCKRQGAGPHGPGKPQNVKNTKFVLCSFRIGFRSSERRHHFWILINISRRISTLINEGFHLTASRGPLRFQLSVGRLGLNAYGRKKFKIWLVLRKSTITCWRRIFHNLTLSVVFCSLSFCDDWQSPKILFFKADGSLCVCSQKYSYFLVSGSGYIIITMYNDVINFHLVYSYTSKMQ
jgi:hypothetical protein